MPATASSALSRRQSPGRANSVRQALQGAAPAGRVGEGAAQRCGSALPRRADLGPGSGRRARGPRADRGAAPAGGDDLSHHAPPRRGGTPLRPCRALEYDPARDLAGRTCCASSCSPRRSRSERRPRSPSRSALWWPPNMSTVRRADGQDGHDGLATYLLTVSDAGSRRASRHAGARGGAAARCSRSPSHTIRSKDVEVQPINGM